MAWNYYKSTDASAPVLSGTAGALITLLDAILVNGYGSKPAAGWSKAFAGTNKAAYRMGSGRTRMYLRVRDTGTFDALARMFESMSDVDTGSNPFPSVAQSALTDNSLAWRKSATADSAARSWVAAADDRTLILLVATGDGAGLWFGYYAGEFFSYIPGDNYQCCLIGKPAYESNLAGEEHFGSLNPDADASSTPGHYVARGWDGVAVSVAFSKVGTGLVVPAASGVSGFLGTLTYPNPADGGIYLSPLNIITRELSEVTMRGRLRGLVYPIHSASSFTEGDSITGVGSYAGRTFAIHHGVIAASTSAGYKGVVMVETSASVPTS